MISVKDEAELHTLADVSVVELCRPRCAFPIQALKRGFKVSHCVESQ